MTRSGVQSVGWTGLDFAGHYDGLPRRIAMDKGITSGSICMFSIVEPCFALMVKGNRTQKRLDIVTAQRKCIWIYHYFNDERLGFVHVRLQSWLPFNAFICLNGRHWLERQMQSSGIRYVKDENCFPWISDLVGAQRVMDSQLASDWPRMLYPLVSGKCHSVKPGNDKRLGCAEIISWIPFTAAAIFSPE
jgi:hypothetical protein